MGTTRTNILHTGSWKLALVVLLLAAIFRLWGAFDFMEYLEDEAIQVPNAISLGSYGTTDNWHWHHPPAGFLIMYGTIRFFGDNPVGWRSSNILLGTLSVALVYLIARRVYSDSATPLIAAALLACDPYHIYLSRNTFTEIPATFFFLLYLYFLLEYTENQRNTLPLAGIAMGLTIATKAYFAFAIPCAAIYALARIRQRGGLSTKTLIDVTTSLILLPASVYLLTYFKWFGRGFTLPEFVAMKMNAIWELRHLDVRNFVNHTLLEAGGKPWEWFIKPSIWGHQRVVSSSESKFLLHFTNLPFRILVLPSLAVSLWHALQKHSLRDLFAPLLFCSCYALIFIAERPMFSYSSIVMLPLASLMIARAFCAITGQVRRQEIPCYGFLAIIVLWGIYVFPLVSGRTVPVAFYSYLVSTVRYMGQF